MAEIKSYNFYVAPADDDWFLSVSISAAAISKVAADFTNGVYCQGGQAQRVALKTDQVAASTVVMTYYSTVGDVTNLVTDTLSVSSAAVTYTTYPVYELVSLTATKVTSATLKVGFQGFPYYAVSRSSHDRIKSVGFAPTYIYSAGHTGITTPITIATEGSPAANKVGYDAASSTIHFCYPVDGSSNIEAGWLHVEFLSA